MGPEDTVFVVYAHRRWDNAAAYRGQPVLWPARGGPMIAISVRHVTRHSIPQGTRARSEIGIWTDAGVLICAPGTLLLAHPARGTRSNDPAPTPPPGRAVSTGKGLKQGAPTATRPGTPAPDPGPSPPTPWPTSMPASRPREPHAPTHAAGPRRTAPHLAGPDTELPSAHQPAPQPPLRPPPPPVMRDPNTIPATSRPEPPAITPGSARSPGRIDATARRRLPELDLLTLAEAAQLLSVSPLTVTRWARTGTLGSIRTPGGHRRYYRAEVDTLLAARRARRPPRRT